MEASAAVHALAAGPEYGIDSHGRDALRHPESASRPCFGCNHHGRYTVIDIEGFLLLLSLFSSDSVWYWN